MQSTSKTDSGLVSIILPTYNGSKYLASAIESCLAQTYANFELILVDDCSKDATPQIIANYATRDGRIRSIRHETNKRLPGALNTGHQAARGDYFTWTSDDNLLRPDFLAEMVGYLQAHAECGLVYSDFSEIDEMNNFVRLHTVPSPERLAGTSSLGGSFLYRRSTFERVGLYDPEMVMAEDYDYWLRCFRVTQMAALHKDLYQYRVHAASLTTTGSAAQLNALERVRRKNLPLLTNAPRHIRAWGWLRVANQSAHRGDAVGCLNGLCRAILLSPWATAQLFIRKIARKCFGREKTSWDLP